MKPNSVPAPLYAVCTSANKGRSLNSSQGASAGLKAAVEVAAAPARKARGSSNLTCLRLLLVFDGECAFLPSLRCAFSPRPRAPRRPVLRSTRDSAPLDALCASSSSFRASSRCSGSEEWPGLQSSGTPWPTPLAYVGGLLCPARRGGRAAASFVLLNCGYRRLSPAPQAP